jgi:hypothetical protein
MYDTIFVTRTKQKEGKFVTVPNFVLSVTGKTYMIGLVKNKSNNKFVMLRDVYDTIIEQ